MLTESHFNCILYRSNETTTSLQNSVLAQPLESGAFLSLSFFHSFFPCLFLSFFRDENHLAMSMCLHICATISCTLPFYHEHALASTCAHTPSYSVSLASTRSSSLLLSVSFFLALSHSLAVSLSFSLSLSLSLPLSCFLGCFLACTHGCTRVHFLCVTYHR